MLLAGKKSKVSPSFLLGACCGSGESVVLVGKPNSNGLTGGWLPKSKVLPSPLGACCGVGTFGESVVLVGKPNSNGLTGFLLPKSKVSSTFSLGACGGFGDSVLSGKPKSNGLTGDWLPKLKVSPSFPLGACCGSGDLVLLVCNPKNDDGFGEPVGEPVVLVGKPKSNSLSSPLGAGSGDGTFFGEPVVLVFGLLSERPNRGNPPPF